MHNVSWMQGYRCKPLIREFCTQFHFVNAFQFTFLFLFVINVYYISYTYVASPYNIPSQEHKSRAKSTVQISFNESREWFTGISSSCLDTWGCLSMDLEQLIYWLRTTCSLTYTNEATNTELSSYISISL